MLNSFVILILFVLSSQVFPVALGIDTSKNTGKAIWFGLLLVFGQFLFLLFGLFLGDRFMHLVEEFKGTVVFIGFFFIGVRMLMDTFKVRKGERTFSIESSLQAGLASSAQGINTFLAGLIFAAFAPDAKWLSLVLLVLTVLFTGIGLLLKPTKQSFVLSSLFFALGGLIMIVSSIYFGFII